MEEHLAARNEALTTLDESVRSTLAELREKIHQQKGGLPKRDNITRTYRVDASPEPAPVPDESKTRKKPSKPRKEKSQTPPARPPLPSDDSDDGLTYLERLMKGLPE